MPIGAAGAKLGILAILTKKFNVFKEKKFCFLADGGGHAPLCPPPGYATGAKAGAYLGSGQWYSCPHSHQGRRKREKRKREGEEMRFFLNLSPPKRFFKNLPPPKKILNTPLAKY